MSKKSVIEVGSRTVSIAEHGILIKNGSDTVIVLSNQEMGQIVGHWLDARLGERELQPVPAFIAFGRVLDAFGTGTIDKGEAIEDLGFITGQVVERALAGWTEADNG